jgi:outer membrane biosynthesis protein TonB
MKLPILISLSLLWLTAEVAGQVQSVEHFFVTGATNYLQTNIDHARKVVSNGLSLYPNDRKLTNLWALLNRNQQQQQQDKNEEKKDEKNEQQKKDQEKQENKDQQNSEQQKQDEQKKQQEQKKQEQEAKDQQEQQSAQDQRGKEPDQSAQQQNYGRVMQMTPQQAQQLLDAQKSQERAMIFQPQTMRTNRADRPRDRVFKDW